MTRPSEPLLALLRQALARRGWNSAALATRAGLDRARVRKLLGGAEALTVDELMVLSKALELSPAELGLAPALAEAAETAEAAAPADPAQGAPAALDPWGNQPEQLVRAGFTLGCDFMIFFEAAQLADSGVPAAVLERFRDGELPVRLDAAYHTYNAASYSPTHLSLTLSFDALYDCTFPWTSIIRVMFFPHPPEISELTEESSEEAPPPKGAPFLRLV